MLIPWLSVDHKIDAEKEGCVADFCPYCCQLTVFALWRINWDISVYGGLDSYRPSTDFLARCMNCLQFQKTTLERYTSVLKDLPETMDELFEKTFPSIKELHAGQIAQEQRLRSNAASEVEVLQRLCDTIKYVDQLPTKSQSSWNIANRIFLSFALGIGVGIAASILAPYCGMDRRNAVALGWLAAFIVIPVFLFVLSRIAARHERRCGLEHVPLIAVSLAPLQISSEQMDRALNALRSTHCSLAFKLNAEDIFKEMKALRVRRAGEVSILLDPQKRDL